MSTTIDITTAGFARRFAALLSVHRSHTRASLRSLAKRSNGVVTVKILHEVEAGRYPLDSDLVSVIAALYGADLASILPDRLIVAVSAEGVLTAGPVRQTFDPRDDNALLVAYLRLVRSLRNEPRAESLVLRRDDVEVLAGYLHQPGAVVLERLLSLMGSTRAQRSAVMALFATGAMVVGLSSGAAAMNLGDDGGSAVPPPATAAVVVVETTTPAAADTVEVATDPVVDSTDAPDVATAGVVVPVATPSTEPAPADPAPPVDVPVDVPVDGVRPSTPAPSATPAPAPVDETTPVDAAPDAATSTPSLPEPVVATAAPAAPTSLGVNDAPVPDEAPIDPPAVIDAGEVVVPPGAPPVVAPTPPPPTVDLGGDVVAVLDPAI